jgi:hypothetical protein
MVRPLLAGVTLGVGGALSSPQGLVQPYGLKERVHTGPREW